MKKVDLIAILIFLTGLYGFSQRNIADTLLNVVDRQNEREQAETYVNLSNSTVYFNTSKALEYAEKGKEIALKYELDSIYYEALRANGYALAYLGRFEESLTVFKGGLTYYNDIKDTVNIAKAYNDIAHVMNELGQDQKQVVELNFKALEIREKINDEKGIAYSLNNIGTLYWEWDKFELAIDYFLKALPYMKKLGLIEELAFVTSNIAEYYIEVEEFSKAERYLGNAVELFKSIDHDYGTAMVYSGLGRLNKQQENIDIALEYNKKSKQIRERIGDKEGLIGNFYNIGVIEFEKENHQSALKNFKSSLSLAQEVGIRHELIQIKGSLAEVYHAVGRNDLAYQYLKESKLINDSIFNAEKHKQIEEIKTKYQTSQKELENQQLKAENEAHKATLQKNKFILILSITLAVFVLVFVVIFFRIRQTRNKLNQIKTEQQLLRSQMNPHFIFNAITAIQSYLFSHSAREVMSYLSSFAALMRQILDGSRRENILMEEEIGILQNYFKLQQLRYPNRFTYQLIVDENIDKDTQGIAPMLCQPFIENAIEHGLKNVDYQGEIKVSYCLVRDQIKVEIEDNGIGILKGKKDLDTAHKSFAVQAIQRRLKVIHKRNKSKYCFEIEDKTKIRENESGTLVRFYVPVIDLV